MLGPAGSPGPLCRQSEGEVGKIRMLGVDHDRKDDATVVRVGNL